MFRKTVPFVLSLGVGLLSGTWAQAQDEAADAGTRGLALPLSDLGLIVMGLLTLTAGILVLRHFTRARS